MPFLKILLLYALAVPLFFFIDMAWLGLVAKTFYRKHLGHLMADRVNWPAAILFYFVYIAGLFLFAVVPAMEKGPVGWILLYGTLFGLFTYAALDLTNFATLKRWPLVVTLADILWGTTLTGFVSGACWWITQQWT